jgi:hypothetical protein
MAARSLVLVDDLAVLQAHHLHLSLAGVQTEITAIQIGVFERRTCESLPVVRIDRTHRPVKPKGVPVSRSLMDAGTEYFQVESHDGRVS